MSTARVDIILRALGAGDVKSAMQQVETQAERLGQAIFSIGAGAVGVGGLLALGRQAIETADRFDELATRLRVSTTAVQVFEQLAKSTGQTADVFTAGIDRMGASLRDAMSGVASAYQPFSDLRINLAEFSRLAPERQLELLARQALSAEDQTKAFSAVAEILGTKNAPALRDALVQLAGGYDGLVKSMTDAGQLMGETEVRALAESKDEWDRWGNFLVNKTGWAMARIRELVTNGPVVGQVLVGQAIGRALSSGETPPAVPGGGGPRPSWWGSAADIGAVSDMADYQAIIADQARLRALAEQDASQWLTVNQAKYQMIIDTLRTGNLSDEVRLIALRDQLATLEAQTATQTEAAAGEKSLLRIRLESEEKRLRLLKEIGELEKASTRRELERNARIGGPDAEALMITPGKQPLGGSGAGEQTRDVDVYQRESIADAVADARDNLAQMGNIFDGIYRGILQTTSGISQGLGGAIEGLILRTTTWRDAWRQVGSAILTSVVGAFSQMVAQYAVSQLAMFALSKIFKAKDAAATSAQATASAAAWAPAATAASIASFGAAAASGVAAFLAALALGTAGASAITAAGQITALAAGGGYRAGSPYLMGEYGPELVIPRESGVVMNHRETAAIAAQLGGGGGEQWKQPILVSSRMEAERIRRGSDAEVQIIEIMQENKYRIFGRA